MEVGSCMAVQFFPMIESGESRLCLGDKKESFASDSSEWGPQWMSFSPVKFRRSEEKIPCKKIGVTKVAKSGGRVGNRSGFTLLEILIVMGLIGFIAALILPRLRLPTANIKKVAREINNISRDVRNSARLRGNTYRLVFQLGPGQRDYHLEVGGGTLLVPKKPENSFTTKSQSAGDPTKNPVFQPAQKPFKGNKSLPGYLHFTQLETENQGLKTEEEGSIYFSPEGLVEKAALQISDDKGTIWTLFFNPLTGHVDLAEKAMGLKDLEAK